MKRRSDAEKYRSDCSSKIHQKSVVVADLGIPYFGINKLSWVAGWGLETCYNERRCRLLKVHSVVGGGIKCWDGTLVEGSWQGKVKHQEKHCPLASLSTINPTWTGVGSNPGLQVETLMTNCGFSLPSLTSGSLSYWVGFWWLQNGSENLVFVRTEASTLNPLSDFYPPC